MPNKIGSILRVWKGSLGPRRSYYRKSFVLILLLASLPGLIISGGIYWTAGKQIEKVLDKLHQRQILQRAQNIDEQFSYLELSFTHWAFEPKFDESLRKLNFTYDFLTTRDLTKTLLVMQGAHPLLKRVELFVDGNEPVLLNPEYLSLAEDPAALAAYRKLVQSGETIYWTDQVQGITSARNKGQPQKQGRPDEQTLPETQIQPETPAAPPGSPPNPVLTLVHKIPGGASQPFGALIGYLDQEKLIRLLKTLTPYNEGATFLIKNGGEIMLSADSGNLSSSFDQALVDEVLKHEGPEGSFSFRWNRTQYSVSYGQFVRIGQTWTYVSAAPVSEITEPLIFISKLILWISAAGLLLALLVSWLASKRMYSPINRLVQMLAGSREEAWGGERDEFELIEKQWQQMSRESKTLQNRLEQQLPHLQQGFLLQLVQGYLYAFSEQDILERMRQFGWKVDNCRFIVVHLQLTGFFGPNGRFSPGDEELATFAAANIVSELASQKLDQVEILNFHDLSVGLLVILDDSRSLEEHKKRLYELSAEVSDAITRILKLKVTLTLTRATSSIARVPTLFQEARQAIGYRSFIDQNQIIDMDRMNASNQEDVMNYPFALEREIVQAVRMGEKDTAEKLVAVFLEELSAGGSKEFVVQQGMLQLLGSLLHAMLQSGINPYQLFEGINLFDQLSQIREPENMKIWFNRKLIGPFLQKMEERSDLHMKRMVEQVIRYIEENYMNDISLENCSDLCGTNAYTLSKGFKQVTGKNFIDFITEMRLDKAREMLRETDLKINEIAERVGYQHSYFNRIFKRQEGVTPSQYREMNHK